MAEDYTRIIRKYPEFYKDAVLSKKELLKFFQMCDAFWVHDDDPARPHAELTSGKCSNGFIDCLRVLKYRNLSQILAEQLARKIREAYKGRIDWVIGSPMAGIYFANDVGEALGAPVRMFVEKDPSSPGKMRWDRMKITDPKHRVLQVEELTTTSKTLNAVYEAVNEGNGDSPVNWLPYVAILVHRPPKLPVTHYGDRKVIALIEKEIWAVDPPCSLCKAGSKRLQPK